MGLVSVIVLFVVRNKLVFFIDMLVKGEDLLNKECCEICDCYL